MKLTAACAFGLEAIVKRELISLGYDDAKVTQPGRICFAGDWDAVCRANIWLRTADRVLVEILSFNAPDFDALFDTVKEFDWSQFLPRDAAFPVVAKSRLSALTSIPAIQRTVKKAMVESLQRYHDVTSLEETGANFRVETALLNDVATVTLDTTGPSLHKRGYRRLTAAAPIKETLAAALVNLSVWKRERLLVDPFCGSGTIPIEAAMMGLNIAPGLQREFASSNWPIIDAACWSDAKSAARDQIDRDRQLQIIGTDRDEEVLSLARYHAEQAGVAGQIHWQQSSFEDLRSKREYGCLITNPPYGERLEQQQQLLGLYESIPAVMQRLPTWSLFLITNMPKFEKLIQKTANRRRKLYNGRIECTYYQFLGPRPPRTQTSTAGLVSDHPVHIEAPTQTGETKTAKSKSVAPAEPVFAGANSKDVEQSELFKNRLNKRARHLRRWPTKQGISCFRLYERDIPEIPLVVDRYADCLHITEYERPHERDLARHAAWLELMKKTAAATLDVPIQKVFMKTRQKNRDRSQYQKLDSAGKLIPVSEGGLKFLVNLSDYVDTGLFLDHRITRQMVREESAGKDFLNLFAYTGSFSVYAAAGGAKSTTTVDLSANYLNWARSNMAANNLVENHHQFVTSDSLKFLEKAKLDPRARFDLAVVDPPTYSNSKSTDEDWDVQKSHVTLLNLLRQVMHEDGIVFFSTNFRRFKLAENEIQGFQFREISNQTVPADFRNRRIHRCWRMVAVK